MHIYFTGTGEYRPSLYNAHYVQTAQGIWAPPALVPHVTHPARFVLRAPKP